jgi:toxin-antitoxin system PIN domain toxin
MSLLSFPDVNVWLALAASEHVHRLVASEWWEQETGAICFTRFSQLSFLRLTTTVAAMDGKPLSMTAAWHLYDRFFEDDRVTFFPEPPGVEAKFRHATSNQTVSPKVWADAWLLAVADASGGVLVTFDKALAARGAHCLLHKRKGR